MTGRISIDFASNKSEVCEVFFPKVARAVRCMVSRRISHFSVAESLGCGAPNYLSKASANCGMRFGCDILLTSIRGFPCFVALDLIKSYLNNRYQFVEYDGVQSSMLPISTGVPQGSILGPLLFIIYINDFPNASRLFNFIMYADDTTLSCTIPRSVNPIENFEFECRLNKELCGIDEWLKVNKLSLNVNKSKYMLFNAGNKTLYPFEIKIDYISIERVYVFNFLGLIMDEHLNWKSHVEKISNKCSKTIGVLNKLKYFLPLTVKLILYNSLILPHLNYGIMTWGYKCDRINKLQKKAIRIVSLSKYNAHTEPIFKRLQLIKVADILKIQELKFYYRFMHITRYLGIFNV